MRDYVHIIDGKEVRIPRGKPLLTADVVPTLLPDLAAYLCKEVAHKRAERKRPAPCAVAPAQKKRLSRRDVHEFGLQDTNVQDENVSRIRTSPASLFHWRASLANSFFQACGQNFTCQTLMEFCAQQLP